MPTDDRPADRPRRPPLVFHARSCIRGQGDPAWYALTIDQREAGRLFARLRLDGAEPWQPMRDGTRTAGRGAAKRKIATRIPACPGYLLVRFPALPRWDVLGALRGVSGVLGYDGLPRALREAEIEEMADLPASIAARIAADEEARRLREEATRPVAGLDAVVTAGAFASGAPVRVVEVGPDVSRVILDIFGGRRAVPIRTAHLRKAG